MNVWQYVCVLFSERAIEQKKNKILNLRAYTIFFNLSIIIAQTESQIVLDFFVRSIEGDSLNCIRY